MSHFGEIAVLMEVQRTASIRAKSYCNMFTLSKTNLASSRHQKEEDASENFLQIIVTCFSYRVCTLGRYGARLSGPDHEDAHASSV